MKNFNDESKENIIKTLIKDPIQRRDAVFNLIKLLDTINDNRIIAINGPWGSGKTFFIKQLELLINFMSNYNSEGKIINPEIKTNKLNKLTKEQINEINKLLQEKKHKDFRDLFVNSSMNCIYFNAWEYDNNNEPILSIIYKVLKDFPYLKEFTDETKLNIENTLISTVSFFSGGQINLPKLSELIEKNNLIKEIQTSENIKEKFNSLFDELIIENSNKMILVIDELDRCKPTYAIKLLEQIKHYIKSDKIIIILTMNMKQLSCSIKNLYGYHFDSEEYLDKIFDLTLSLKPVDKTVYLNSLLSDYIFNDNSYHNLTILDYINYKNIDMREINRYLSIMMLYDDVQKRELRFENFYRTLRYVFLPYFIGQQIFNYNEYEKFITGKGFDEFYEYIQSSNTSLQIINYDLDLKDESSEKTKKYIKEIYDAVYVNNKITDINGSPLTRFDLDEYEELCSILKHLI